MQSRLAVLMVADMVDYTRMMDTDQAAALRAVQELRDTYLEPVLPRHDGTILKRMGDGWIIEFPSVSSACQCAKEVQSALASHKAVKLRIGLHIGEITQDKHDFYGPGVNLAHRVQAEAPPGGLMASQDFYRQLPINISKDFRDAGSFQLKNIALPLNLYQWRPHSGPSPFVDDVPTIHVEAFGFAPDNSEAQAAATDLRDQLIVRLSRRTGVRVLDDATGRSETSIYQLRGRLRISGERGRLNLSLVQRDDGVTAWSQAYEGDPTDIFSFCDNLIERADSDLRVQINAFDGDRIADLSDDELSVSELRSRAASLFYKLTVESWEHACGLLERALRLKPADPMSLAMRGEGKIILAAARYKDVDEEQSQSLQRDLNAVIESSPRSDYAFWTRALFRIHVQRDPISALEDVRRTLSLSPAYSYGFELKGLAEMQMGDFELATESLKKSVSLSEADPLLPQSLFMLAVSQLCSGNPTEAANTIEQGIQLRPNERAFLMFKAECFRRAGKVDQASELNAIALALSPSASILAPRPPLPDVHQDLLTILAPNPAEVTA